MGVFLVVREHGGGSFEGTDVEILGYRTDREAAATFAESVAYRLLGDLTIVVVWEEGHRVLDRLEARMVAKPEEPQRRWQFSWRSGALCYAPEVKDDWPVVSPIERHMAELMVKQIAEESSLFKGCTLVPRKEPSDRG